MNSISRFLQKVFFGKLRIYEWLFLATTALYFFSIIYFNREGFSKIAAGLLIFLFALTVLRALAVPKGVFNNAFWIAVCMVVISSAANAISGYFSYDFLLLAGILYSAYMYVSLEKHANLVKLLCAICIGGILGYVLVVGHYVRVGLDKRSDMFFGNIDGVSGEASTLAIASLFLGFLFLTEKKNKALFVVALCSAAAFIAVPIFFSRIGSILKDALFLFLVAMRFLYLKKKKAIPWVLLGVIALFVIFVFIPWPGKILSRLQTAIVQPFRMDVVLEDSVRERIILLLRDLSTTLRMPFLGYGGKTLYTYEMHSSHSFFGSIATDYGLVLGLILIAPLIVAFANSRLIRGIKNYVWIVLFITGFSIFYGVCFVSRPHYFYYGACLALLSSPRIDITNKLRSLRRSR